ncbi:general secretion pathway protein GspN [Xanthobacter autotrophicus]|uniref:general secretion pathway protein GspN n=1 Tax=Xanthobacter autotrophicus TaxID=280 RepID=UPI0024A7A062|nr:general secretion pathway protein GspN [Xanthobacter autotrophicus]MDI4659050.1 general secretion pathway protein GspN [Xanthobacter autotrophicus]
MGLDQRALRLAAVAAVLMAPAGLGRASDLDASVPPAGPVQVRAAEGGDGSAGSRLQAAVPRGNPLWSLPLDRLDATRARPIFSPTRRPPTAIEAPPPAAPTAPVPVAPARPRVTLIGTLVGQSDAYGIFLDPASNAVLRLRTGETHEGWVLRSVSVRDALLQNGRNSVVLALPVPGNGGATPAARAPDGSPLLARPGRPAGERPTAHIIAPFRPAPALSDIESSH